MDYKNGKIYQILNTINDECYIGSTCQKLSQRLAKHRKSVNSKDKKHLRLYQAMRETGIDKFYIELVEECPCDNIEQLRAIEGNYTRQLGTLNHRIEARKKPQYTKDTKENKKEYNMNLRLNNSNLIECEICGSKVKAYVKGKHAKTKKHQEALNNLNNINNVSLQTDNIRTNGEEAQGEEI